MTPEEVFERVQVIVDEIDDWLARGFPPERVAAILDELSDRLRDRHRSRRLKARS